MLVAAGGHLWSVSTRGCWFCWNKIIREETAALIVGAEEECGAKYDILYHGWAGTRDRPDYPSDILHLICRIGPADREVLGHGDKYKCRFNVEQNIFLCNPTFYLP